MKWSFQSLVNLTAFGALIAFGVVHGRWTGRWVVSRDVEDAVSRLAAVPEKIGDWTSRPFELGTRQTDRAGIAGYVARRYEAKGRDGFTILLVCGPPGPIAVHSPDVCYKGAGYNPEAFPVPSVLTYGSTPKTATFLEGVYSKTSATGPDALRIDWTYKADGPWEAPTNPRLNFGTKRVLYKLYVIQDLVAHNGPRANASPVDFARVLLPALDEALSPKEAISSKTSTIPATPVLSTTRQ